MNYELCDFVIVESTHDNRAILEYDGKIGNSQGKEFNPIHVGRSTPCHLYVLSPFSSKEIDGDIKEGDLVYDTFYKKIKIATQDSVSKTDKKVIAATDKKITGFSFSYVPEKAVERFCLDYNNNNSFLTSLKYHVEFTLSLFKGNGTYGKNIPRTNNSNEILVSFETLDELNSVIDKCKELNKLLFNTYGGEQSLLERTEVGKIENNARLLKKQKGWEHK